MFALLFLVLLHCFYLWPETAVYGAVLIEFATSCFKDPLSVCHCLLCLGFAVCIPGLCFCMWPILAEDPPSPLMCFEKLNTLPPEVLLKHVCAVSLGSDSLSPRFALPPYQPQCFKEHTFLRFPPPGSSFLVLAQEHCLPPAISWLLYSSPSSSCKYLGTVSNKIVRFEPCQTCLGL